MKSLHYSAVAVLRARGVPDGYKIETQQTGNNFPVVLGWDSATMGEYPTLSEFDAVEQSARGIKDSEEAKLPVRDE